MVQIILFGEGDTPGTVQGRSLRYFPVSDYQACLDWAVGIADVMARPLYVVPLKRREPVKDADYPYRVVRKIGWQRCLKCRRPFFSEDVLRLRLCSGADGCREDEDRFR